MSGTPEYSDFLNDDDEFDIEEFARQYENTGFTDADDEPAPPPGLGNDQDDPEGGMPWLEADAPPLTPAIPSGEEDAPGVTTSSRTVRPTSDELEVSPVVILEGMLFVGNEANDPLTAEQMSALMRGVAAEEIDDLVGQLNQSYRDSHSPFEVILEQDGYRMVLASGFEFCRQRFYREEKAATLAQPVIDVLALVAYLQPVTRSQIEAKRHKPSGSILNQLVRRRLLQIERQKMDGRNQVLYRTTDRFLELFELESLDELPQARNL